jgi:hypothetical protein
MATQVFDYPDVEQRATELGCNIPTGLALLPRHFDTAQSKSELLHESSVIEIRRLLRQQGIIETRIEQEGEKFPYIDQKSFEWIGPTILLGAALMSQNPYVVSVLLNIISSYLFEVFRGVVGDKKVKLDIVVEQTKGKKYTRIHYEGGEDLKGLDKVIHEVADL